MEPIKRVALPVDLIAGQTYTWCACGFSQTLPLCDDSQQTRGVCQSQTFVAEQSARIFLCACARTATPPYCDGINCD